jgi:hypothetical protein
MAMILGFFDLDLETIWALKYHEKPGDTPRGY